jgi:hypothetical protein
MIFSLQVLPVYTNPGESERIQVNIYKADKETGFRVKGVARRKKRGWGVKK